MTSITDFDMALAEMTISYEGKYVYYASADPLPQEVTPFAQIHEGETTISIIPLDQARAHGLDDGKNIFSRITIKIPATLESTGLTSALSVQMTSQAIPANVITSIQKDHFMVPSTRTEDALSLLKSLADQARGWTRS